VIAANQVIRAADLDSVPAATVERDYILAHVLTAIVKRDTDARMIFKGGTAMRLCYFEDYRYSADLDFSLVGDLTTNDALTIVSDALDHCVEAIGLPTLLLNDQAPARIEYVGPLNHKPRRLKLDLAADELVEETTTEPIFKRYADQESSSCPVYTLDEMGAEKLRCVLQRLQCRDLYDLHELLITRELDLDLIWPVFERKSRHRGLDPTTVADRLRSNLPRYEQRWDIELSEHVQGGPPHFDGVARAVRRVLRPFTQ